MSLDTQSILKRRRYEELMQAGRVAYKEGKRQLAHDYWREAATVDPYNEQVWLSLYRVLEKDEDRIVCLENIIAINPMNVQARRRLRVYQEHATPTAQPSAPVGSAPTPTISGKPKKSRGKKPATRPPVTKTRPPGKRERSNRLRRVLIMLLIAVLLVLLVLVAAALLSGR